MSAAVVAAREGTASCGPSNLREAVGNLCPGFTREVSSLKVCGSRAAKSWRGQYPCLVRRIKDLISAYFAEISNVSTSVRNGRGASQFLSSQHLSGQRPSFFNSARSGRWIDPNAPNSNFVFQRRGQSRPEDMDTAGRAPEKQAIPGGSVAINKPPLAGFAGKLHVQKLRCTRMVGVQIGADKACCPAG